MEIGSQIAYYNDKWREPLFANLLQMARCVAILQRLQLIDKDKPRICDLGCGTGWLTNILASFGPALGVDFSDTAVKEATEKYPAAEFQCADIMAWDYPRNCFDVVVSQEVLEHVEDQARYISIAHGLLRPGGYIILTTPNAKTMLAMPEKERREWTNQPIENWVKRSELSALLHPSFQRVRIASVIFGYGSTGTHRVVNSYKVNWLLNRAGLDTTWKAVACRMGFGLHLVAMGRKR